MRPLIITHILQKYRLPAVDVLKSRYPNTHVVVSDGGPWASGRNAPGLELRDDVTVIKSRVVRVAGAAVVLFPGLRRLVEQSGADVLLLDPRMGLPSVWSLAVWPPKSDGRSIPAVWWYAGWKNTERPGYINAISEGLQRRVISCGGAACYGTRARSYALELGIPPDKAVIAQNATDTMALERAYTAAPAQYRDRDGILNVVYVGAVEARKRLGAVIDAMACPPLRGAVRLRIVGNGPEVDALEAHARALCVAEDVQFVPGTYSPSTLAGHLRWADVGILPNQGGLFLNTAMSCGVPVICGKADGTEDDLVEDGATGWRIPCAEPNAIAAVMRKLLADRASITEVGCRARAHYHEIATLPNMIDGIDAALSCALQ